MDKQKKQLIALVALILVGGIVALWSFGIIGGGDKPAPKKAEATPPPAAQPGGTTPAAPKAPAGAAKGAAPGAAKPVVKEVDLDLPPEEQPRPRTYLWEPAFPAGSMNEEFTAGVAVFDPLRVKNVDIVNPELKKEVDELKKTWVLDGITIMPHVVKVVKDGVEVMETRDVIEAWFVGRRAPFKLDDRLTGTRYRILEIVFGDKVWVVEVDATTGKRVPKVKPYVPVNPKDTQRAMVRLLGDKGNVLDLELAPADRYGEDAPKGR